MLLVAMATLALLVPVSGQLVVLLLPDYHLFFYSSVKWSVFSVCVQGRNMRGAYG